MDFRVSSTYSRAVAGPHVVLIPDNWNDYSYHTLFTAVLYLSDGERVDLGSVKIARLGQSKGEHQVPAAFMGLSDDFVSLGQDSSYYEILASQPASIRSEVLDGLRDAGSNPDWATRFANEDVWQVSVLRFGTATELLRTARDLLGISSSANSDAERSSSFSFVSTSFATENRLDLRFNDEQLYASRMNAVIGYNGSGKTTLLANLALVAHADSGTEGDGVRESCGRLVGEVPTFSSIIMVSYSAFDSFALPGFEGGQHQVLAERAGEVFGYSYCGLREVDESASDGQPFRLKNFETLADEFGSTVADIRRIGRLPAFFDVLARLAMEPSFAVGGTLVALRDASEGQPQEQIAALFNRWSTGHKIALMVIAHLVRRLQRGSLVLIDEPEAHLHPSLLSALLTTCARLLEVYDSVAVVATHSPVVLQEIPSVGVHVLRRSDSGSLVSGPGIETFGESVGIITSHVFHLDGSATDYHAVLDRFVEQSYNLADLESAFPRGLSAGAKAYFLSQLRREG